MNQWTDCTTLEPFSTISWFCNSNIFTSFIFQKAVLRQDLWLTRSFQVKLWTTSHRGTSPWANLHRSTLCSRYEMNVHQITVNRFITSLKNVIVHRSSCAAAPPPWHIDFFPVKTISVCWRIPTSQWKHDDLKVWNKSDNSKFKEWIYLSSNKMPQLSAQMSTFNWKSINRKCIFIYLFIICWGFGLLALKLRLNSF